MAGTNKVLKPGTVLFRAGDQSDGMYLIRRGELQVYLEQNGKEVKLATIGEGGMIGEMALFDKQPRSASVKATKETEVTLISLDDFGKLMKQIPKWFVGLMTALSGRLRTTNTRLQQLESAQGPQQRTPATKPYQNLLRQLHLLSLIWTKDGEKDGKDFTLQRAQTEKVMVELYGEPQANLTKLFELLVQLKVVSTKTDSYKNVVFASPNKAQLTAISQFITDFATNNPQLPCLPDGAIGLLRVFERMVLASPYDQSTHALEEILKEGKKDGMNTQTWDKDMQTLVKVGEDIKVVKTSSGLGLRGTKKEVSQAIRAIEFMNGAFKAGIS